MNFETMSLLTDFYELTMMQGYFNAGNDKTVVFDVFYRINPSGNGFAITAGLEQVIDYIKNLKFSDSDIEYLRSMNTFSNDFLNYLKDFKFTGDIYAIPEGTIAVSYTHLDVYKRQVYICLSASPRHVVYIRKNFRSRNANR